MKINPKGKYFYDFSTFYDFIWTKVFMSKKVESVWDQEGVAEFFDNIFVEVQVTNKNGESAKRIRNKNIHTLHLNAQLILHMHRSFCTAGIQKVCIKRTGGNGQIIFCRTIWVSRLGFVFLICCPICGMSWPRCQTKCYMILVCLFHTLNVSRLQKCIAKTAFTIFWNSVVQKTIGKF